MRILRIAERLPPLPGGEEYHVLELTRRQIHAGHTVRLVYRAGDGSEFGLRATRTEPPIIGDTAGSSLSALAFGMAAAGSPSIANADICHVHGDFTDAMGPAIAASIRRTASVLTVHGGLNMRYRRCAAPIYRRFRRIIALGDPAQRDLLAHGVEPERIVTMSSGLNRTLLDEVSGVEPNPTAVVAVGSLIKLKNFGMLIRAFRATAGPDASLTIVGGGPMEADLRSLAGGDSRITLTGALDRRNVYRLVAQSRVFVMPSVRMGGKGEGVPTALLEAMYLGKDCLVSREAEPRPVVTDPLSYATFDPNDLQDLQVVLRSALEGGPRSQSRSSHAREAVQHLGWDRVTERVESVYWEALGDPLRCPISSKTALRMNGHPKPSSLSPP